jgi:hypothetical protein
MGRFAATRVRTDPSWRRALELAAGSREATPWYGARWQPTYHVRLESPMGARREATHAGGGPQPEERHGLAVKVYRTVRRRKKNRKSTEGFRINTYAPIILYGAATRSACSTSPSLVGIQLSIGFLR